MTITHTPTPWHIETTKIHFADIYSLSGVWVAHCESAVADSVKDAAFIVRACNTHDDLLALAKMVADSSSADHSILVECAKNVLKLARGE